MASSATVMVVRASITASSSPSAARRSINPATIGLTRRADISLSYAVIPSCFDTTIRLLGTSQGHGVAQSVGHTANVLVIKHGEVLAGDRHHVESGVQPTGPAQ